MYNFDLVHSVLLALLFIICHGWSAPDKNIYGTEFDMNLIDKLDLLFESVYGSKSSPANKTKFTTNPKGHHSSGEELANNLLFHILNYVKVARNVDPKAVAVAEMLQKLKDKYSDDNINMASNSAGPLLVKCKFQNEAKIIAVQGRVSLSDFKNLIKGQFGFVPNIQYMDGLGDLVIIESDDAFRVALAEVAKSSSSTFTHTFVISPSENASTSMEFHFALPNFSNDLTNFNLDEETNTSAIQMRPHLLRELSSKVHFSEKELNQLYSYWQKNAVGDMLTKEKFMEGLQMFMGITDPLVLEQNFSAFKASSSKQDDFNNQSISFQEFAVGLSTLLRGKEDESLRFIFNAYDVDGSGSLSRDEVMNIFKASMAWTGTAMQEAQLHEMTDNLIREIDINNDGQISYDEFVKAIGSNKLLIKFYKVGQ